MTIGSNRRNYDGTPRSHDYPDRVQFVLRLLRTVLGDSGPVVLRHRGSGVVLSAGVAGQTAAVRFDNAAQAEAFSARFLDEAPAWQPVPAGHAVPVAA
jgi:hypothetical protein